MKDMGGLEAWLGPQRISACYMAVLYPALRPSGLCTVLFSKAHRL